jgi:hypothetical protein
MSSSIQEANQRRRFTHPTFSFVKDPKDLENLSLHESPYGDLTLRAARDLEPNSILFTLPFDSVLTYDVVRNTKLSRLIMDTAGVCCSPEILVWLNMVCWYKTDYDVDNIYSSKHLRALSKEPPNVSSWPSYLQDLLIGTNIYSVLDDSGKNDNTLGNVHVIQKALSIVEEVRQFILLANANNSSNNNNDDDDDSSKAIHKIFIPEGTSIFNKTSIGWARGHFVSRRFPELKPSKFIKDLTQQNQHTIGYGDRLSCFIPLLDLMNHNPEISSTCTVSLEGTDTVVIRIGTKGVKSGDELIYRYGNLSNETLLQGYGFCLGDNGQDAISFRIRKHQQQKQHENIANSDTAISTTDNDGEIFFLKKGGVSGIPKEFWEAIAGKNYGNGDGTNDNDNDNDNDNGDGDGDDDQQLEIGLGDLQKLKEYVDGKLKDLFSAPGWLYDQKKEEILVGKTPKDDDDNGNNKAAAIHLDRVRKQFIQFYLKGQKEVLEKLHDDLVEMLQQCSDLEDVEEQFNNQYAS